MVCYLLFSVDSLSIGVWWIVNISLCSLNCFGLSAVYRLSMALLMLYILLLLIMLCRNRISKVVNEGLFLVKYCLVVGAFIGLLFVQNKIF